MPDISRIRIPDNSGEEVYDINDEEVRHNLNILLGIEDLDPQNRDITN